MWLTKTTIPHGYSITKFKDVRDAFKFCKAVSESGRIAKMKHSCDPNYEVVDRPNWMNAKQVEQ